MAKEVIIEFRAELNQIKSQLKQLQGDLDKTGNEAKEANENIKKIDDGGKKLIQTFKNLATAAGLAFGAREIINFAREAVTLAGKLQGVEAAFRRIGNEALLDGLRRATQGTVSDLQLMQSAVRASNFEIPLEQLASLFEFARRRAKETGEEVDYLVESIILGIGRKSPLILDNLGISAVRLRQELKGVSAEAASVGDVAAVVGKIATESLQSMGEESETAADKQQRLSATFKNMQIAIGQELIPVANKFYEIMIDALGFIDQYYLGDTIQQAKNEALAANNTIRAVERYVASLKDSEQAQKEIMATREALIAVMGEESRSFVMGMTDREIAYRMELEALQAKERQMTDNGRIIANEGTRERQIYDQLLARIAAINGELAKMEAERLRLQNIAESDPKTLEAYEEQIKALQKLVKTTEIGTAEYYKYKQQLADVEAEYKRLTMSAEDIAKIEQERIKRLQDMQKVMRDSIQLEKEFGGSIQDTAAFFATLEDPFAAYIQGQNELRKEQQDKQDELREQQMEDDLARTQEYLRQGRQMYINYGMTEAEYTEYSMMLMKKRADFLLQQGAITREEYDKIMRTMTEQSQASAEQVFESMAMLTTSFRDFTLAVSKDFSDKRLQMSQAELLSLVKAGELTAMEYEKIVENQEKLARFNKAMAFFEITFNTAKALSNVIASNSATGPLAPITIAKGVAVVLAGMAQVAAVLAQANPPSAPRFEKGGWIGGRSHADGGTMIEAEAGEFIINKRDARANKDILKAINTGNLSKYVVKHYVEPLTRSMAQDRNSLAENIAASLAEQMAGQNGYLRKMSKGVRITNPDEIARWMTKPNINRVKH